MRAKSFSGLSLNGAAGSMPVMVVELIRLLLGLALAWFHRPIADYVIEQERSLVALAGQRGLRLPAVPSIESGRSIYFGLGIFVAVVQLARIYLALHGAAAL